MDNDELATKFPRSARLLGGLDILSSESVEDAALDDGNVRLISTTRKPAILIHLANLESALSGFRDTGTWGDYFPPADDSSKDPKLTVPNRGAGIAKYRIDTTDEENAK